MRIDCYLSPECASEEDLRENITRALAIEKVKAELYSTELMTQRLWVLDCQDRLRYLLTVRNCSLRELWGFPEGCTAMSLADSLMRLLLKQYGRQLRILVIRTNKTNHNYRPRVEALTRLTRMHQNERSTPVLSFPHP